MAVVNRLVKDTGGLTRVATVGDLEKFTRATAAQAADSNQTISGAQVANGLYLRTGMTAGRTDTLDTGANLDIALPGLAIGESVQLNISVQPAFALTLGLAATGITNIGTKTVIAASGSGTLLLTKTGIATYNALLQ